MFLQKTFMICIFQMKYTIQSKLFEMLFNRSSLYYIRLLPQLLLIVFLHIICMRSNQVYAKSYLFLWQYMK